MPRWRIQHGRRPLFLQSVALWRIVMENLRRMVHRALPHSTTIVAVWRMVPWLCGGKTYDSAGRARCDQPGRGTTYAEWREDHRGGAIALATGCPSAGT